MSFVWGLLVGLFVGINIGVIIYAVIVYNKSNGDDCIKSDASEYVEDGSIEK